MALVETQELPNREPSVECSIIIVISHWQKCPKNSKKTLSVAKKKYDLQHFWSLSFNSRILRKIFDSFYKNPICDHEIKDNMVQCYGTISTENLCKTSIGIFMGTNSNNTIFFTILCKVYDDLV